MDQPSKSNISARRPALMSSPLKQISMILMDNRMIWASRAAIPSASGGIYDHLNFE